MNIGTKIRTILAVATCLNTALMATDVTQFGNETVNTIYKVLSVILNFVIVACVAWYNNDYTPEAVTATIRMREAKEKRLWEQELIEEPADSYVEESEVIADEVER